MMMWIIAGLFAVLAIPLLLGKGGFLIAGYNTASKEEKAKYNEKKLCRTMGIMCAFIAVLTAALAVINTEFFAMIYGALLIASIVITVIYANTRCGK